MAPATRLQRKRSHDLRKILDCILWLLRTGSQWRSIHPDWLPWQAVYYYFDQWKRAGLFEQINARVNQLDRQQQGRDSFPSVLCIDSHRAAGRSVKLLLMSGEYRGLDAHKRVNGRKRTYVVDTQGRLWLADVDAANRADGTPAVPLVSSLLWRCGERLEKRSAVAGLRRSVL